jgi:hypothetical protein
MVYISAKLIVVPILLVAFSQVVVDLPIEELGIMANHIMVKVTANYRLEVMVAIMRATKVSQQVMEQVELP